jgi:DNA-directed RNA polymerase subunit K/omega
MEKKTTKINKFKLVLLATKQARLLEQQKVKTLCTKKKQPITIDALKQVLSVTTIKKK